MSSFCGYCHFFLCDCRYIVGFLRYCCFSLVCSVCVVYVNFMSTIVSDTHDLNMNQKSQSLTPSQGSQDIIIGFWTKWFPICKRYFAVANLSAVDFSVHHGMVWLL